MSEFLAEVVGTMILVLMGNGVVANVLLTNTKGNSSGWLAICVGWGAAVATAVMCVGDISGAHLNPAVTIGLAGAGVFEWAKVPGFVTAQMLGAMVGAALCYLFYMPHYQLTKDLDAKLGTFCTAPQVRSFSNAFLCECIATFILVYAALVISDPSFEILGNGPESGEVKVGLGAIGSFRIGLVVFTIGICLGGTSGYAINPARDLGPRIVHQLIPMAEKRDSDWAYSWVPVLGPIVGGLIAAGLYLAQ